MSCQVDSTRKLFEVYKHQSEFIHCQDKYPALIGGYGSGKTYSIVLKGLQQCGLNPGKLGVLAEPTTSMVKNVLQPTLEELLREGNFNYSYYLKYKKKIKIDVKI